ncbi:AAA family ATPase [Chryseobacterium sp. SL1]|uniref:AAA family ATPase n=1 Tax=Chryseobacterium sp. SL1 TaxID=2995159 RepID=UPI002274091A|nr:AAA family ATPase [Chryseobacterium sp. SL1]MCY1660395.1 AAA family ATPase [Chryseobacterium sp. SL1]
MDSKTLQASYDKFIKTDNTEQSEWYKNIKDFTEYMSVIRKNTIENKYTCYQELNDDFKVISNNIGEDFLQRYLFESNNGFSTIRNQLIQLEKRILIRQKVENNFSLLKDIISNNDIHETYDKIESLIDGKNKTVIYRFLRAIFPNDFTSIDSPFHLNTLIKKLSNDFLINIESSHQIEKNNEILALIKYDDIFKAQIFFWKYRIQNELNNDLITSDDFENTLMNKKYPLNQILYGAPGTGKTYNTKRIAVEIITGKSITNRSEINKEFEILKEKGHIKFTTFHQSLSYEDFIEGIKPDINDKGDIIYSVKDGIFKSLCNTAKTINLNTTESEFDFNTCSYYKMSLGGLQNLDKHYWCLENDLIFLGWGGDRDFTKISRTKDWITFRDKFKEEFPDLVDDSRFVIQAVYQFQNMKIGDIVLVSKGNKVIDAVGIIQSEYFYDDKQGIDHYQFRKVKWLGKNLNLDPSIFVRKSISQQTIYQFYNVDIKNEVFQEMFNTPKEKKYNNYVLIIDEINRGNVSAIFGELITLIEDDKRDGKENSEKIELTLPYSQNEFSVPDNLYIIGTMNTADRSVEALDSALRRRFSFTEMKSNPTVLEEEHENRGIIENNEINLASLLLSINSRIELLIDKDHQIGHSYFIKVRTLEELKYTFKNKILPLLEEYFYGDFGKIGLVLGDNFVSTKTSTENRNILSNFNGYEDLEFIEDKKMYIFKDIDHMIISDFTSIYND